MLREVKEMMWECEKGVWDRMQLGAALGRRIIHGLESLASSQAALRVHAARGSLCFCIWQSTAAQQQLASCCDTGLSLSPLDETFFVSWVHREWYPFNPFCLVFNVSGSGFLAFVFIFTMLPWLVQSLGHFSLQS